MLGHERKHLKMAATVTVAIMALCAASSVSTTQFGYAPDEPIGSIQDLTDHARDQIQQLGNNFKRLERNAENDANQLLQVLQIQSNDPEGLLALVTEAKFAIAAIKPTDIDVSACEDGNDQKYQAMVQEAATGIPVCLQNASLVLQPYYQNLRQMLPVAQNRSQIALSNVTACANQYTTVETLSRCLNLVGDQVFDGRDMLMAAILGEMADFKDIIPKLVADFTVCTNNVQDKAIGESVAIIQASRECIRAKVNSADSNSST